MQEIISTNNAKVKQLLQLQKKSALRKKQQEFIIEGVRELKLALANAYQVKTIYYFPELISLEQITDFKNKYNTDFQIVAISKNVFQKLAYRNSTEGIIAVTAAKSHRIDDLSLPNNSLSLIAERIEKPGNIGAMLRTVDGSGVDAIILVDTVVDLYNPNIIRASLGTVFTNQIAVVKMDELGAFLNINKINLYAATLQNANDYTLESYTSATAIAVGAEDKGLTESMRKLAYKSIKIEMKGQADSLNVSVSAAILLFEAVRQRKQINN